MCVCVCVCVCVHVWRKRISGGVNIYILVTYIPVTCLISKNSPTTMLLCFLDTVKLEYKGLDESMCIHSMHNLGG